MLDSLARLFLLAFGAGGRIDPDGGRERLTRSRVESDDAFARHLHRGGRLLGGRGLSLERHRGTRDEGAELHRRAIAERLLLGRWRRWRRRGAHRRCANGRRRGHVAIGEWEEVAWNQILRVDRAG